MILPYPSLKCSSVSLAEEFQHVQRWSDTNKLQINISKTKELVFRRPSVRHFTAPPPLSFVEQLTITKLPSLYFLPHFPLLHMLNTSYLLLISECTYLHSSRVKGCRVMLYTLYLLPLYCLLSLMLCHLLRDSCQSR